MKQLAKATQAIALLCASSAAIAQSMQCPDIAKTLKEYSIDSSSSSYLNAVFTQHCQQDGSRKSSGGGIGLDAVIKAVPIKFTGNYSSADEALTSFCKTYSSQTAATALTDSYKETISVKALETIQQCNALQATGVLVTHQINNVEAANFYLRNSVTQSLEVQGVSTTGGATCEGQISGKKKSFDSTLSTSVKSTLSFSCKRTGSPYGKSISFPESIVTVLTNQGNYSLFWPKDERQSQDMATQIDRRITSVEGEIAVTKANVLPLVAADSLPVYRCPTGATVSHNAPWMYAGCNGQISAEKTCVNVWYNAPTQTRECTPVGQVKLFK